MSMYFWRSWQGEGMIVPLLMFYDLCDMSLPGVYARARIFGEIPATTNLDLRDISNCSIDGSPIPGVIPRAVAYLRMGRLHAPDCECILDVTNRPHNELL
uniref:Leucine-rich repeat-containing N-terminal plant-type domain-containing protein n=1 Tax=Lactuca sativa TaxID=4236 RepID=A0A9R1XA46_LACSA|nr:hypothetical protein LSAT_V11C500295370 [Lactuca sativa]